MFFLFLWVHLIIIDTCTKFWHTSDGSLVIKLCSFSRCQEHTIENLESSEQYVIDFTVNEIPIYIELYHDGDNGRLCLDYVTYDDDIIHTSTDIYLGDYETAKFFIVGKLFLLSSQICHHKIRN